jgi:hypothetical protein
MSKVCYACGAAIARSEAVPRDLVCEQCAADVRCCRNCRFYDVSRSKECRESEAELVTDKSRRNFCEFFELSDRAFAGGASAVDRAAEARAKLDALFKKKPAAGE